MKALTLTNFGSSEVLQFTEVAKPGLGRGEILVATRAIGLNYADIMRRKGIYPLKGSAPYINGYEGAGVVIDNNHQTDFKVGDRIGFADVPFANAEMIAVPVSHAIPLPDEISFETAASLLLQGLSAHFLSTDCHQTKPGETVLIHAAAGGVGQLLVQICKILGARVIGLVSTESKKQLVLSLGADEVFLYDDEWTQKVLLKNSLGVDVVFDSIGNTMHESLQVTKIRGQVVFFGLAGGDFKLGDPLHIIGTSKTITGGDLWNYLVSKEERIKRAAQIFTWIKEGNIKISAPTKFSLAEGKQAHDYMESRKSTGKILLIPQIDLN